MTIQRLLISLICILFALSSSAMAGGKHHEKGRGILNKNVRQARRPQSRVKRLPQAYNNKVITYFGGTPVVTSPYLGLRSEFDGSDLIVNLPSVNEDLRLLKHRYILDNNLYERYHKIPETPLIELSGQLGAIASYTDPYHGNAQNDIDLTDAELDVVVHAHEWVTGFMAINYDNSPKSGYVNHRVSNSRLFLNKGFITLGNLRNSPFYMTIGQLYVPFGRYKSHMIVNPLTQNLGRSKQRAVVVGFKQPGPTGLFANVFYFKGNAINRGQNNGGAHLGYAFSKADVQGEMGASFLFNLADADRLQMTGQSAGFPGFASLEAAPLETQQLDHAVQAFHAHINLSYEDVGFLAEYVTALRDFSVMDLSYNMHGARPWAVNVEGTFYFSMDGKPASFSAGYGHSQEALALQIPNHRIAAAFSASFWRDTIETLEIRHDIFYPKSAVASGRGIAIPTANAGKTATTITGKVVLYF